MYARFLGLVATACGSLLSACAGSQQPAAQTAAAVEPEFDGFSLVYKPYQELLAGGVPSSAFDQGCFRTDFSLRTHKLTVTGRGDGRASVCEAIEEILTRHNRFPDQADRVAGIKLYLSLEATGELASFADALRHRIDSVQERLEQEISRLDMRPGSYEFEIRRALALFAFAMLPQDGDTGGRARLQYWKLQNELHSMGLDQFWDFLTKQAGGLGLSEMQWIAYDADVTHPLRALREKHGTVLQRCALLYAVFAYAGLKVQMAIAPLKSVIPHLRAQKFNFMYSSRDTKYFYLSVDVGDKRRRFLDPNLLLTTEYPETMRLSLREYSAYRAIEYGNYSLLQGNLPEAMMRFVHAAWLVPQLADAYFNMGNIYLMEHNFPAARSFYKKALAYDSHHSSTLGNLAALSYMMGEREEAEKLIRRALVCDPENHTAVKNYVTILMEQDRIADAITFVKDAIKMAPEVTQYYRVLQQLEQLRDNQNLLQ